MSPEVIGLVSALVGATAGLGGGLTVQVMQTRAHRKQRIATLGAQLAAASYVVVQAVPRARDEGQADMSVLDIVDLPEFRDDIMAASELAIIAPDDVAKEATDLANTMARAPRKAGKALIAAEWSALLTDIRRQRKEFIQSMRDSKLQFVVQTGLKALAAPSLSITFPFGR